MIDSERALLQTEGDKNCKAGDEQIIFQAKMHRTQGPMDQLIQYWMKEMAMDVISSKYG